MVIRFCSWPSFRADLPQQWLLCTSRRCPFHLHSCGVLPRYHGFRGTRLLLVCCWFAPSLPWEYTRVDEMYETDGDERVLVVSTTFVNPGSSDPQGITRLGHGSKMVPLEGWNARAIGTTGPAWLHITTNLFGAIWACSESSRLHPLSLQSPKLQI